MLKLFVGLGTIFLCISCWWTISSIPIKSDVLYKDSYYVSNNGNDTSSWKSPSEAFQNLATALKLVKPGQTIYVQAWIYNETLIFPLSWKPEAPIVIEGYRDTPGDRPTIADFNHLSIHDASKIPLIQGEDRSIGTAILLSKRNHIHIRNFQIHNYKIGIHLASSSNNIIEDVYMSDFWDIYAKYDGKWVYLKGESNNNTIKNVIVVNSGSEGFFIGWDSNMIDSVQVYASDNSTWIKSSTDYYVVLTDATNTVVQNSYIERVWDLAHNWHGFSIKGDNSWNTIRNNISKNLNNGWFVARHRGAKNNVFIDNEIIGWTIGIMARDGASYNTFQNTKILWARDAIVLLDSTEDGGKISGWDYNTFKNIDVQNTWRAVFSFNGNTYIDTKSTGNVFDNIKIEGAKYLIEGWHISEENILQNSTIKDVENFIFFRSWVVSGDIDFQIIDTNIQNSGFDF